MAAKHKRRAGPRPNRVTPFGDLIAVRARGTWMGNRGRLHNAQGHLTKRGWTTQAWLICRLTFKGRRRKVMTPGRYTELFFLDEATALAAGHRPCGECRRAEHQVFRFCWLRANGHLLADGPVTLSALDRVLHQERLARRERRESWLAPLEALPDGAMVLLEDAAMPWLVHGEQLLRWTPSGYRDRQTRPSGVLVRLVTPPSIVGAIAAGYRPALHPSAEPAWRRTAPVKRSRARKAR